MLTSFQFCWSKRTTMADGEVETEETQAGYRKEKGKKERNWRNEEIELLITLYEDKVCLWDVAYEAEAKLIGTKGEVAYCQIDAEMSQKYDITRDDGIF